MPAFSYEYKIKGLVKAAPEDVGELFERLEKTEKGLTPSSVLDASREEGTLLHHYFEWDDSIAGEKYRQDQARFLIRNLIIVEKTDDQQERAETKDRAFVITPGYKSAYVALDNALTNAEWRNHLLKNANRDMEIFTEQYKRLSELADVIQAMKAVM